MIDRVVVATKNADKVREVQAVLAVAAPGLELVTDAEWPDVEETGDSLAENALLKARAAAMETGIIAIADDTGLEVDALGGRPGVHTARFAGPSATYAENRAALLRALEGVENRTARFRTNVAMVSPSGSELVVEGVLEGRISREERGKRGFGYDSVFEVDGVTLAEMTEEAKNAISHRARALAALADAWPE